MWGAPLSVTVVILEAQSSVPVNPTVSYLILWEASECGEFSLYPKYVICIIFYVYILIFWSFVFTPFIYLL